MTAYSDKRVLVIGGGAGIGLATARKYLDLGAKVAVMDINLEGINKFKSHYPSHSLKCFHGDVRNKEDITSVVEEMDSEWQGIDIMVYSTGIFPDKLLLDMDEEEWDKVMDTNTKGAFLASQTVAKKMIKRGNKGHIVTISSGSYRSARIGSGHYCASKAALVMLTKVLAFELSQYNIVVNSIAPGLVEHPILAEEYKKDFVKKIPMNRIGEPEDIASSIIMITSPENTYMTGQVIQVDGGLSAGQYAALMSNKGE